MINNLDNSIFHVFLCSKKFNVMVLFVYFYFKHFGNRIIFICCWYSLHHPILCSKTLTSLFNFFFYLFYSCTSHVVQQLPLLGPIILNLEQVYHTLFRNDYIQPSADNGALRQNVTVTYSTSLSTVPRFVALGFSGYKFSFDTSIYNISVSNIEANFTAFRFLV